MFSKSKRKLKQVSSEYESQISRLETQLLEKNNTIDELREQVKELKAKLENRGNSSTEQQEANAVSGMESGWSTMMNVLEAILPGISNNSIQESFEDNLKDVVEELEEMPQDDPGTELVHTSSEESVSATPGQLTGFKANLTSQQREVFMELKKIMENSEYKDEIANNADGDEYLLKFLRATMKDKSGKRIFSLKECKPRLTYSLDWRREYKVDYVRQHLDEPPPRYDEFNKIKPSYTFINPTDGRLVFVEKLGKLMSNVQTDYFTDEEWNTFFVYDTERMLDMMRKESDARGVEISSFDNIIDVAGISTGMLKRINFVKTLNTIASTHYPESVNKVYVVNAPYIFASVYGMVQKFLDPVLADKISIVKGKSATKKLLSNQFEMSLVPKEYGGELDMVVPVSIHAK